MSEQHETAALLQEIRDDVRAVRSEMTSILIQVTALSEWRKATEKAEADRDHERRLRRIEDSRAWLLGASAIVAAVASAVMAALLRWVAR